MTKRTLTFLFALMTVVVMQAQSLDGKWLTTVDLDDNSMDVNMTISGKTILFDGYLEEKDQKLGTIGVSWSLPGTFTRNGNMLNVSIEASKIKFDIIKTEFAQEVKDAMKEEPGMEELLNGIIKMAMSEAGKKMADEFPVSGEVEISSLTANKLVFSDGDDNIEFNRVK